MARYNDYIYRNGYEDLKRYIYSIFKSKKRFIEFSTIHSAKGDEADYVFLMNVNDGYMGFPSSIEDDPILNLVVDDIDNFEHEEERRPFYVALTRTKKRVYLYGERGAYFIEEINLTDEIISETDWIIAYHDETVIGARMWNGKFTDIPAMGSNGTDATIGYAMPDITPHFKLYRTNSNQFIDLDVQNIPAWQDLRLFSISLSELISLPESFSLDRAYPNPFNPTTTLSFAIPVDSEVSLSVYNLQGREVSTLIDANMDAGYHSIVWDANSYASGVYFVKMMAGEYISTQKLMLIK